LEETEKRTGEEMGEGDKTVTENGEKNCTYPTKKREGREEGCIGATKTKGKNAPKPPRNLFQKNETEKGKGVENSIK